jgi:hypothetical protein
MRLKGKRKVYQSISSAFSRISSPRNSLEIATSIAGTGSPTSDLPSSSLHPRKKRQRIYQSISSTFSRRSSPMENSPQPTSLSPANLPEIFISPTNPSSTSEEEDDFRMIDEVLSPMENEVEVEGGGSSLRPEPEIDEPSKTAAQPQSDTNGTPTGKFTFALSVEEVKSALEDLKKILKPP